MVWITSTVITKHKLVRQMMTSSNQLTILMFLLICMNLNLILVPISYAQKPPLNDHAELSSWARCLTFGQMLISTHNNCACMQAANALASLCISTCSRCATIRWVPKSHATVLVCKNWRIVDDTEIEQFI